MRPRDHHDLANLLLDKAAKDEAAVRELLHNSIPVPEQLENAKHFTPFGVEYRYEALPFDDEELFDREKALGLIQALGTWAETAIAME